LSKRLDLLAIACMVLAVLILPAAAVNTGVNTIAQGGDVFIGEEGLDISACVGNATNVAWFASGGNPATDEPDYVLTVSDPATFYVGPALFSDRTGNWYQWTGSSPAGAATFNVKDPYMALAIVSQQNVNDVTFKSIPQGEFLNFWVETNMITIALRPGYNASVNGPFTIKVVTPDETTYVALYQDAFTTIPLTGLTVTSQPDFWVPLPPPFTGIGWNTGMIDSQGTRVYQPGVYTVTVETNVNNIKNNYQSPDGTDYIDKTVSMPVTVTIANEAITIAAGRDPVVRGNPFSVTITGKPSGSYVIWVRGTGGISGTGQDRPPFLMPDQEGLTQDIPPDTTPVGAYQYEGGAGRTVSRDVPPVDPPQYYGLVTLKDTGTRTIGWQTTRDTRDTQYTIRVEAGPDATLFPGVTEYTSDEVAVRVEKGTVTIVAAGDQSYYPGQEVILSGTNAETETVPATIPTMVPTMILTTVPATNANIPPPTTVPAPVPTTVPTTTTGFGGLIALAGLGAGAFLIVRKE